MDDSDLGTIPAHILPDEVLYKRYMNQELGLEDSSSSDDERGKEIMPSMRPVS